jgi:hypothetical protein
VDHLDLIDGTPVLDIKPYQPGWDCVFSAVTQERTEKIRKLGPARYRQSLIREAVSYHGEWCTGAAIAVRMAEVATSFFGDLRKEEVSLVPSGDPCIIDALIGITGARPGNGRFLIPYICNEGLRGDQVILTGLERILVFTLQPNPGSPDEILEKSVQNIFEVKVNVKQGC